MASWTEYGKSGYHRYVLSGVCFEQPEAFEYYRPKLKPLEIDLSRLVF